MDGHPPTTSAPGVPGSGMNDQNFLQQLFTADVAAINQQQQQQQGFYCNPNMFGGPQAAAVQGAVTIKLEQMLAQQQQQMPNLYAFASQGQGTLQAVNPLFGQPVNAASQPPTSSNPNPSAHHPQGGGTHPSSLTQYDDLVAAPSSERNSAVSDIGGVSVPPMAAGTPTLLHVEAAAHAAATAAAPSRKRKSAKRDNNGGGSFGNKRPKSDNSRSTADEPPSRMSASAAALIDEAMQRAEPVVNESTRHDIDRNNYDSNGTNSSNNNAAAMTPQQKAQSSREKNREHARCTRLRKKAYVNKLKELVDGLHAERSEDTRKRRVAVQALAGVQEVSTYILSEYI